MKPTLDEILKRSRVIVCAGSGGVGKTTMAAAMGTRAAQLGLRVLVLTVDPAKRLATALGLDLKDEKDRRVEFSPSSGQPPSGELWAAVIDSKKIFDGFIQAHAKQPEVAARIMKNRLYQQLSTTLAGSQEFTALERLLQSVESGRYDLVILDTPPTKHAMDFLTAPQRINSLFQDAVTRWFMAPSEKVGGFFTNLVSRGTRTVLKSLEALTGAQFIEELIDFFSAVRSIQGVLRERSESVHRLMTGPGTRFIVVTSFDAAKLMEARYLQGQLEVLGYHLEGVVINRAFPLGIQEEVAAAPAGVDPDTYGRVLEFYKQFKDYYSIRYNLYEEFSRGLDHGICVVRVPEYQRDVHGLRDLEALAEVLADRG
jgi:anion-transporting  ArsA/GET3 family ATPase